MKDFVQLLWGMVGAIVGLGAGVLGYFAVYKIFPDQLGQAPTLSLVVVFALAGGGMVGGGWLALYLAAGRAKAQRHKAREERSKFGSKRRNR